MESDLVERIAKEVGVSSRTVLRCLSGAVAKYGATARRMEEIKQVAERLGYAPNIAARSLRQGIFGTVAILSSAESTRSFLPSPLLSGIQRSLMARGLRLTLAMAGDDILHEPARLRQLLKTCGADGLLLDYIDHVPPLLESSLKSLHLPIVWINRNVESDGVRCDDLGGAASVVESFWQRGKRRIAYVDFSHQPDDTQAHYSAAHRYQGWRRTLAAHRSSGAVLRAWVPATGRLAAARQWLRSLDAVPDAVMGYSTEHAAIVVLASQLEGIGQLTLADVGALGENAWTLGQAITCYRLPWEEVAESAVGLLLRKIEKPGRTVPTIVIPGQLVLPPAAAKV